MVQNAAAFEYTAVLYMLILSVGDDAVIRKGCEWDKVTYIN